MKKLAKYRCWKCNHHWEHWQGPSAGWDNWGRPIQKHPPPLYCPICKNLYMTWENYTDFTR